MKRTLLIVTALLLTVCLSACAGKSDPDSFTVRVICESDDIYMIFYSCYIGGEYFGMGGMADLDGNEITEKTELKTVYTKAYFEGRETLPDFSMTFSPYGKDDQSEIGTTKPVSIPAEYGKSYTIVFSGDRENGYTAELTPE